MIVQPDRKGATLVLLVCCTSVDAGVFHWVQAAAVGLQAAAWRGVVGTTDGYAVGAMGTFTAAVGTVCLAAAANGVLVGCSVTSTLGCMSGLTASG